MEREIKEIIDEKIINKEIIFTASILNIFLSKTKINILQEEVDDIEEKIEKSLITDDRLIELYNGKYGEKEYIKEICKDVDESQYKNILEEKYFCFFKELNTEGIKNLYQQDEKEEIVEDKVESESNEDDIDIPEENQEDVSGIIEEVNENGVMKFDTILSFGLNNGYVTLDMLEKIDYDQEEDLYDSSEMLEKLEEKGIEIR